MCGLIRSKKNYLNKGDTREFPEGLINYYIKAQKGKFHKKTLRNENSESEHLENEMSSNGINETNKQVEKKNF
jgi:hypothetical protein